MLPLRRVGLAVLVATTALLVPADQAPVVGASPAGAAHDVCGDGASGGGWPLAASRLAAECDAPLRELGRSWREQQPRREAPAGS